MRSTLKSLFCGTSRRLPAAVSAVVALVSLLSDALPAGAGDLKVTLARARTLKRLGQKDEALRLYQRAVKSYPKSSDAHDRLGFMLFETGQFDQAVKEMKEAIRLDPRNANAYHHLGSVYLRLNRIPEAADQFRTAMALDPSKSCNCGPIERLVLTTPPAGGVMTPEEADRILSAPRRSPPTQPAVEPSRSSPSGGAGVGSDKSVGTGKRPKAGTTGGGGTPRKAG